MKILAVGDIIGNAGVKELKKQLVRMDKCDDEAKSMFVDIYIYKILIERKYSEF